MSGKRKQISLSVKAEIVSHFRKGVSQTKLSQDYGLAKSTISTIIHNGNKIMAEFEANRPKDDRKRLQGAAYPELAEKALYKWFEQVPAHRRYFFELGWPVHDSTLHFDKKQRQM
ncbi:Uncharacterised protein r2_g3357 [Pycnogonum litorale]